MKKKSDVETFDITPEDSVVPIYHVPLSSDQEHELSLLLQAQLDREKAQADAVAAKDAAYKKLNKLGLSDEEIKAVLGGY